MTNTKLHHTALTRGYVSVKSEGVKEIYSGRYGKEYTIKTHNPNSTSIATYLTILSSNSRCGGSK